MEPAVADDRVRLRQRWYDEGWFGDRTLADLFCEGAASWPGTELVFAGGDRSARASLAELLDRSRRVAGALRRLGIGPGDAIAVQVPNWLEGAVTYGAAMLLGAVIVPVIHIYGPAEVGFILRQSEARVLIVPDRWRRIDYLSNLAELGPTPALERTVVVGDQIPPGAMAWSALEEGEADSTGPGPAHADEVAFLIYTSGTTGDPKGVQHSHNTLATEVKANAEVLGQSDRDAFLATFPAGHIAGVLGLLRTLLLGAKTVYLDVWEPTLAAALVEEHRVTASAGTPFFLSSLLDAAERDGRDLTSLTSFMVGAASVPPTLIERADRAGIRAYRAYGSTEHPVMTTGRPEDPASARANTDGPLMPGSELRLVDDDGNDVGPGEQGELACRGPQQFLGYRNPAHEEGAYLPGGWFLTGDLATYVDGYLQITDRKKDIIIRGGENLSSKEIEDVLLRHPDVADAAVVAMADERLGERVCAFVVLREDGTLDLAAVDQHFRAQGTARQKTPERIEIVDELPRGPGGKVNKVELRARLTR